MLDIDLSWLVGGRSYTIPCSVFCNRYQVSISILADTRANAFILINSLYAKKLFEFLNTLIERLPKPILVYSYNSLYRESLTTFLQAHLHVDGQR